MSRRGSTLRIGRLAGVPIGIHPLWLVIVALITLALGRDYFPTEAPGLSDAAAYLLGLASALALFVGILLHELGHAVVARRHGLEVEEIDLWLLGGVARMTGEPKAPGDELRFALAGPAVTAVLLATFGALRLAAGDVMADWVRALVSTTRSTSTPRSSPSTCCPRSRWTVGASRARCCGGEWASAGVPLSSPRAVGARSGSGSSCSGSSRSPPARSTACGWRSSAASSSSWPAPKRRRACSSAASRGARSPAS